MKHIVQFSGGAGSFAAACEVVKEHGTDDTILLFADTKTEDEDTYRFLREGAAYLQCKLVELADGRDIWEVLRAKRFLGNSRVDPCSQILKRDLCRKWIEENFAPSDCVIYVGIDWTEAHRMRNVKGIWGPYTVKAPLADPASKYDKLRFLDQMESQMGIRRNHLYTLGMPHSNCGGGCIKAGIKHFLHLLKVLPETFARWEFEEQKMRDFLERDVSILKDRRGMKPGDKPKPLTLRQVRERQEELDADKEIEFDWGGVWLLQRSAANATPCFASGGVQ